jgi:trimeric autotransporter adhesin
VPDTRSGWGRAGHRRAVLVGAAVIAIIVGGGAAAWAEVGGGSTGYRMGTVTRADIGTTLTVVGNVEPVSQATPSFQVEGQVATVSVSPGQSVTTGQTLGTLDTTALSEAVSSAQSTVQADEAKLTEDESAESTSSSTTPSSGTSSASPSGATSSRSSSSPTSSSPSTSTPTSSSGGAGGGQNAAIAQDQKTLTRDEATLGTDQQKEAADLVQAQTDCTNASTATTQGQAACEAALQTVSADEEQVSKDQDTVSKDELALQQALDAASSAAGAQSANSGAGAQTTALHSSRSEAVLTADITGNSGTGNSGSGTTGTGSAVSGLGSASTGGAGSAKSDSPEQIASDQAAIDTAEAQLTDAQESLSAATLTSPIDGTVVSVGISAGDTVSANSSTETITIIGTTSYEAQSTLDSSQVPSIKVGQSASVEVDGIDGTLQGTVAQVGPVESTSTGYSYPVLVALPATGDSMHSGSAANITISTGTVSDVVAVPTSAVQSLGSRSYVLMLSNGQLTRKIVTVGMVGNEYTQVLSGLTPGQSVVLADYAEAVPSSSTNTVGGVGGLLGGGGGGTFFSRAGGFPGGGGGGGFFQRTAG